MSAVAVRTSERKRVACQCGHVIYDGEVIRSRCVRVLEVGGAQALCRCKKWVAVPVTYSGY